MENFSLLPGESIADLFPFNAALWLDTHPSPHIRKAFARLAVAPLTVEERTAKMRRLAKRAEAAR